MKNSSIIPKHGVFMIFFLLLVCAQLSSQWVNQSSPSGFNIFSSSFPSSQTGYACGYGNLILKTTNGGSNWIDISLPGTAPILNSVWFLNDNTGFIASTIDSLLYTTNGGANWIRHFYTGSDPMRLFFINSQTGWVTSNKLYKTTNAGVNWFVISNSPAEDLYFINENTGWKTTYSGGSSTVHNTTDGGINWSPILVTSNFNAIYAIKFIDQNTGWVSGYREYIAATTNGGVNWIVQRNIGNSNGLYAIEFVNQLTGYAAGDAGVLLSTTNGGANWIQNQLAGINRVEEIDFINQSTGWAVGSFGKIYKTTNGGLTPVQTISETAESFSLSQNYPNPFNPVTKINFSIPSTGLSAMKILLAVYDISGKQVSVLVNNELAAGSYYVDFNAAEFSSGIYFYKLEVSGGGNNLLYSEVKKMSLVK